MSGQATDGPIDPHDIRVQSFDDFELTLGDVMRGERATLGKSLLDVQRDLKIKADYIAAIEGADLSAFETPGFISGYVRAYARYLGMNPDWVYARFCEESGFSHVTGLEARVRTKPRGQRAQRQVPAHAGDAILARSPITTAPRESVFQGIQAGAVGALLVLCVLIAGLGYGGWTLLQEIQRVTLAPAEPPLNLAAPDPEGIDLAGSGVQSDAPSVDDLTRLYRPQALDQPVLVPRDGPIAMLDPAGQGFYSDAPAAPQIALAPPPPAPPIAAVADALEQVVRPAEVGATPGEVQVVAAPQPPVVLFAVRPAWVRVRAADGTILFEKILEQGERYVLPETEAPPTLRAGNSGSLFFAVEGETFGPAGPGTSVAKNVELSPTALRESFARADLGEDPELARIAALVTGPGEADPAAD